MSKDFLKINVDKLDGDDNNKGNAAGDGNRATAATRASRLPRLSSESDEPTESLIFPRWTLLTSCNAVLGFLILIITLYILYTVKWGGVHLKN
jgi:hypothetical protein